MWQHVEPNDNGAGYSEQPTYLSYDQQVANAANDFAYGGGEAAGISAETGMSDLAGAAADASSGSSILEDVLMALLECA